MRFNHFDRTIFGITISGQGSTNAVEGTHRAMLRNFVVTFVRRLSLRLDALRLASWRALKGMPASRMPMLATCPSYSAKRQPRDQRGVVETRGTVGVC